MTTLNSGFAVAASTPDKITDTERDLIDSFMKEKGVQVLQPGPAASNEASKATNRLIAQKRREFRKKNMGKTFQKKED